MMIYSVLQFVASDFILFLLCILIDYHIVIRMNIHGLVYKQLLFFFFFFSSLTMVWLQILYAIPRVKEIMPHKESVYVSTRPNLCLSHIPCILGLDLKFATEIPEKQNRGACWLHIRILYISDTGKS